MAEPFFLIDGEIENVKEKLCPQCKTAMHIHSNQQRSLRHLPFGSALSNIRFNEKRYFCPKCHLTANQEIPFKAEKHFITTELETYTKELLQKGLTNKMVAEITGLNKNTVKEIDMRRLKELYTEDGKKLKQPEQQAKYLGIDEFKLHDGHQYATVIINLETGHILWLEHGKKKQVVFDFIDHVGEKWMDGVEAIACDMNSDFQEAFEEKCCHIQVVFDFFHIVKNFNDKVISAVRKDEYKRLNDEGNKDAAKSLKSSRFILTSKKETLERKDNEAKEGKILRKSGEIFKRPEITRKEGYVQKYEQLMKENKLLFTADLIKEKLIEAYKLKDEIKMASEISEIMELCEETGNKHFQWFSRLLDNHFEGIIAHATYSISSGNSKIWYGKCILSLCDVYNSISTHAWQQCSIIINSDCDREGCCTSH